MLLGPRIVELLEDFQRPLAEDIGQHIQPSAVSHPQHDLVDAMLAGLFDRQVQQRDQALRSFQREGLRADIFLADKLLEDHRVGQARENADLGLARNRQAVLARLHPLAEPIADVQVVDVHELHADRSAIRVLQPIIDFPQRTNIGARDGHGGKRAVQIVVGEAVKGRIKLRRSGPLRPQRIEPGEQVPANAIRADELVDTLLPLGHAEPRRVGRSVGLSIHPAVKQAGGMESGAQLAVVRRAICFARLDKISLPRRRHCGGVAQEVFAQPFNVFQAQTVGLLAAVAHRIGHLQRGFPARHLHTKDWNGNAICLYSTTNLVVGRSCCHRSIDRSE